MKVTRQIQESVVDGCSTVVLIDSATSDALLTLSQIKPDEWACLEQALSASKGSWPYRSLSFLSPGPDYGFQEEIGRLQDVTHLGRNKS